MKILYLAHNIGIDGLHRALQGRATREDILNMKRNGMKKECRYKAFLFIKVSVLMSVNK